MFVQQNKSKPKLTWHNSYRLDRIAIPVLQRTVMLQHTLIERPIASIHRRLVQNLLVDLQNQIGQRLRDHGQNLWLLHVRPIPIAHERVHSHLGKRSQIAGGHFQRQEYQHRQQIEAVVDGRSGKGAPEILFVILNKRGKNSRIAC